MNKKIFLLLITLTALVVSIIFVFFSFEKLEKQFYYEKCYIVKNLIDYQLEQQMQTTIDWAQWDDTVNFILKKYNDYVKSNIDISTLKNLKIDFMIFFDRFKNPFYSYFINKSENDTISQQVFILKLKTKFYNFLSTSKKIVKFKTIDKIGNEVFMLTFYPILRTSGKSPAFGTLVFGKKLTDNALNPIKKIISKNVILNKKNLTECNNVKVSNFFGYIPLKNFKGETVAIIKLKFEKNKSYFIIKWFIILIIFILLILIILFMKTSQWEEEKSYKKDIELLTKAIDQAKTGVILTEYDGTIFYVNDIVCKITGYKKEELYGKKSTILLDEKLLLEIFNKGLKEKGYWKGEIIGKTKFGENVDLEINISPVFDTNKKIRCFITTCEFISEKKKIINELEKAKKDLEEFNKLKSAILSNLSHEIKTPLTGIIGFIDLLEDTDLTEEQKKYLLYLKNSSTALLNLLTNFIELSKLEANLYAIEYKPFSIKEMNKLIIEKYKPIANEKGLIFRYVFDNSIPEYLIGSEKILSKIISLILDNAVKFTEKGSIEYICKLIDINKDYAKITFFIKDTGKGMTKEELSKAFYSFTQADVSSKRKFEGAGIGLALVKKYVKALNGTMDVYSEKEKGTEFKIIFSFKIYRGEQDESNSS